MNIQPQLPASFAAVAGTSRAAARSADQDQNAQANATQQRAAAPAGTDSDIPKIEQDASTGDRDADGRDLNHPRRRRREQEATSSEDSPNHEDEPTTNRSPNGGIDFQA